MVVSLYQEPTTNPKIDLATPFWHNAHLIDAGSIRRMVHLGGKVVPVARAPLSLASYRPRKPFNWQHLPTSHLGVPDDYYDDEAHATAFIDLRLPANVLPRYVDFVYRVALRAVAVRSRLHFLSQAERTCLFCTDSIESYTHLLVECRYTVAIWKSFAPLCRWLEMRLPRTLVGFLYDEPAARASQYKSTIAVFWPILRACVWYTLWL
ncbi:hypothetical protein ACHHYP_20265 [Achlya hypogyna]|uniref:Reverse transcriptase zinc-binding domain-containing protein n=1 Tax=Achlya hypogyna TaxID=1202772 RepID=A0A1V9YTZ0_ACHHY|nr:hypothetical protein ACHHYP_20265 [Achlya hypogyna]